MKTYLTRIEHEAAGDYGGPVKIRGHWYRVSQPPTFEPMRDTAKIDAVLLPDAANNAVDCDKSADHRLQIPADKLDCLG